MTGGVFRNLRHRAAGLMVRRPVNRGVSWTSERPTLEAVRERIDAIDAQLLALIDERSALAREVARRQARRRGRT